jgi:hypothetical protein
MRFNLIISILICYLIQITISLRNASLDVDYLFILHDAGESYFSQTTIDRLKSTDNSTTLSILTLGSPATDIFSTYKERITLNDIGIDTTIIDGNDGRSQILSIDDLGIVVSYFNPKVVIEGMVYMMESQIGNEYKSLGFYVVGLYNSFGLYNNTSIPCIDFIQPKSINEVFWSASIQSTGISSIYLSIYLEMLSIYLSNKSIYLIYLSFRNVRRYYYRYIEYCIYYNRYLLILSI